MEEKITDLRIYEHLASNKNICMNKQTFNRELNSLTSKRFGQSSNSMNQLIKISIGNNQPFSQLINYMVNEPISRSTQSTQSTNRPTN